MKILFTDLDGTLLNNNSEVSAGTKAFLNEFLAAGNKLVLSSGRPKDSVLEVKNNAGLTQPGILLICSNGALVYDCDFHKPILERTLPLSYVSHLQKEADAIGLHIQTYTRDSIVCREEDEEIQFYRRRIHLPLILADDYTSALNVEPYKMLAIDLHDRDKLLAFCDRIAEWSKDKIQYIFSNEWYLELFVKEAGKGNAVRFICDYYGVPLSDAYAAGDADNDISMIQAAGCGIAMANAPQEVKDAADIVTRLDNDRDGLAECMRELLNWF
ncbi:MAG: HAD family phosphatase [Lachnospiraceae bacterium]|nr:HAD family phosphatase [Lachnospiraceae bacterium]